MHVSPCGCVCMLLVLAEFIGNSFALPVRYWSCRFNACFSLDLASSPPLPQLLPNPPLHSAQVIHPGALFYILLVQLLFPDLAIGSAKASARACARNSAALVFCCPPSVVPLPCRRRTDRLSLLAPCFKHGRRFSDVFCCSGGWSRTCEIHSSASASPATAAGRRARFCRFSFRPCSRKLSFISVWCRRRILGASAKWWVKRRQWPT